MSKFQSYGVTPDVAHMGKREFYECGTRIKLLMNLKDPTMLNYTNVYTAFSPPKTLWKNIARTQNSLGSVSEF